MQYDTGDFEAHPGTLHCWQGFGAAKFWYSMPLLSKNVMSITFMGERCCLTFVFRAWPGNFQVVDSCFSRGLKWNTQVSFPVTIFIIRSLLLSIICNHSPHTSTYFRICSLVRQCGICMIETLRMPYSFTIRRLSFVKCSDRRTIDELKCVWVIRNQGWDGIRIDLCSHHSQSPGMWDEFRQVSPFTKCLMPSTNGRLT